MAMIGSIITNFNLSTCGLTMAVGSAIVATIYHSRRQYDIMIKKPTRILGSLIVVMGLIFCIMIAWYVAQPATMSVILAMEGNIPAEGNPVVTLLKLAVNYWGAICIVLLLVSYGIMQAQKRDVRGERYA